MIEDVIAAVGIVKERVIVDIMAVSSKMQTDQVKSRACILV